MNEATNMMYVYQNVTPVTYLAFPLHFPFPLEVGPLKPCKRVFGVL